jgi:D-galactarolactone cycloisomerase
VPCYATTGYVTPDGNAGLERQLAALDMSCFVGAKIKIGLGPKSDVERVRIARRILGDDALLMVDVNGNYTVDVALESIRRIEQFNIHWYEEPLPPADLAGFAELRSRSTIPLATGEGLYTVHAFKQLVDGRCIDILQPGIGRCGGFSQAKTIANLAGLANLRVSASVWGGAYVIAAAAHFLASLPAMPHTDNLPYPTLLEYDTADNPLRDKLLEAPLQLEAGGLRVPRGPGLGIDLDMTAMKAYQLPG